MKRIPVKLPVWITMRAVDARREPRQRDKKCRADEFTPTRRAAYEVWGDFDDHKWVLCYIR